MTIQQFFNNISLDDWTKLFGLAFLIAGVLVNLTPSKKDNDLLLKIKSIFDYIVPNLKLEKDKKGNIDIGLHKDNFLSDFSDFLNNRKSKK
jgi:hypothetical protein